MSCEKATGDAKRIKMSHSGFAFAADSIVHACLHREKDQIQNFEIQKPKFRIYIPVS